MSADARETFRGHLSNQIRPGNTISLLIIIDFRSESRKYSNQTL